MAPSASVLVVDDDPATLIALPDMLRIRLRDVSVDAHGSALTALQAFRKTNYGIVLADLRMPEMDGLTLLRKIHQVRNHTPVVMMSGVTEWGLAKRASEAGAFAFVQKPFECVHLAHTVRLAIQCSHMRERVMCGKRRLARLSNVLKRAQASSFSSQASHNAVRQLEQIESNGLYSIARVERLLIELRHRYRPVNNALARLEEQGRAETQRMLETLGE